MLFSTLIGVWLSISYWHLARDFVIDHVTGLVQGTSQSSTKVYLTIFIIIYGVFQAIQASIFIYNNTRPKLDFRYPDSRENRGCNTMYYNYESWMQSGYQASLLGAYLGILVQNKMFSGELFL